jgi:hypothetical protein
MNYFLGLASYHKPPDLSLLNSYIYRLEPQAPDMVWFFNGVSEVLYVLCVLSYFYVTPTVGFQV